MAFCYLTSPFFLQCCKRQYNSFKIDIHLQLINTFDLHHRHRIKIYFIKKEDLRTLNSKNPKISHILLLKAHPH